MSARRPLLFYSAWPLGYHNLEAERKAEAFAGGGYNVAYVAGVGTRNPRLSSLAKLGDLLARRVRQGGSAPVAHATGLREASLLVLPPRQIASVRDLNARWLERQLRRVLHPWTDAVAWVRWPTPELVDALDRLRPAVTIYECVDAYDLTPGIIGSWTAVHDEAERRLVARSDTVVVPGEVLAERFRGRGVDVEIVPHGVDLWPWPGERSSRPRAVTVGFVGTLDYKLELPVLRHIAKSHPEWQLRLIGPVQERFDPSSLTNLLNVSIERPVAHQELATTLASFDAGIMPYFDHPLYRASVPLKNLELLAAGLPAVARPNRALLPFREVLYFAESPEAYVHQLERALREDSPERALRRRKVAEANSWDRRTDELLTILAALCPPAAGDEPVRPPAVDGGLPGSS